MKIKTLLFTAVLSITALSTNVFAQTVLQSENHNGIFGAEIKDNPPVSNIDNIENGAYVIYEGVDLTGVVAFSASVAVNQDGDRPIVMYLTNGLKGAAAVKTTELGTITYAATRTGWQTYFTTEIIMLSATETGVHDIIFEFPVRSLNTDFFTLYTQAELDALSVADNVKEGKVGYYPNPVNDALTIEMPTADFTQYTILDITGKVVKEEAIQSGLRKVELNVSDLSKGMYLINLQGIERRTFKFIKE